MPPQPVYCSENNLFRVRAGYDDLKCPPYDSSRAGRGRVGQAGWLLQNFSPPVRSLLRAKREPEGRRCPQGMKAPVGLLSRRPVCKANAACSARQGPATSRRGRRRVGSASASCLEWHSHPAGRCPTAPPCFGRWPRSSPLQTKGCSPLIIPKQLGSIQKIQVASLKDFLCCADLKSLARRNVRATACFHADVNAPAGSQHQQMPFAVTTLPVKSNSETAAAVSELQIKILFPLFMLRAKRRAFQIVLL